MVNGICPSNIKTNIYAYDFAAKYTAAKHRIQQSVKQTRNESLDKVHRKSYMLIQL